jgi:fatty-acyl-CoA synthase
MHTMLAYEGPHKMKFTHKIEFLAGGAPPPPAVIHKFVESTGIQVSPGYGLTEVFGPVTRHHCQTEKLSSDLLVQTFMSGLQDVRVMNRETMKEVPADGKTLGEVMIRGNVVMKGTS